MTDALIIYHLKVKLDYARADDAHYDLDVIAADVETAKKKADEEIRLLFANGVHEGTGLRGVEIKPKDNSVSALGGWYREVKDILA